MQQKRKRDVKHYYGIAKICFYIMVFNMVVRLDLWVSIAGIIIILPYLLNRLLLKKIDTVKYLSRFNHYIDAVKTVHQKTNISQTQENINSSAQAINPIQSTKVDFAEPSFEAIWQDCPQVEFLWIELDYQESHD